jgi:hypothetical protein
MTETSVLYETQHDALCSVLLRMSPTMKSIAIACDSDAAVRLRKIARLWPRVIAAQQSNMLSVALDAAVFSEPQGPQFRIQWDNKAMAPTDEFRLRELIKCWPALRPSVQKDLVEHAESVTGASLAAAE